MVGTIDIAKAAVDDLYLGIRAGGFDLSAGRQAYSFGTGMFIGDGAPEGSARGAINLGPYKAWERSVILRYLAGEFSADAFYLDADEIYEPDTNTTLAGAKVEYALGEGQFVGLMLGHVIASDAPYPQSVAGGTGVVTIADGRDGLDVLNLYGRWNPMGDRMPGFLISGDIGLQRNDRIDMRAWGARVGVSNTFTKARFTPTLGYNVHVMSGDDPATTRLERFDPLFNSGADWAPGGASALILGNTNIQVHRLSLTANLSPRDIVGVKYFHIRSQQINSPIPIDPTLPAPGNVLAPGLGKHVADDIAIDYTRVLAPNAFLNLAVLYSKPGELVDELGGAPADGWFAMSATVTMRF